MREKIFAKLLGIVVGTTFCILALGLGAVCQASDQVADYILTNGKIFTVNEKQSWAEAIVVKGNKIIFVGTVKEAETFAGETTKIGDLKGKMVMPGLVDTHLHAMVGAVATSGVWLAGIKDVEQVVSTIRDFAQSHPKRKVIFGWGYGETLFGPEGPTKELLDKAISDRPAYIVRSDGHSAWVNTKGLQVAKVNKDTPDPAPPAGTLGRDETGNPTGAINGSPANVWMVNRIPGIISEQSLVESAGPIFEGITEFGITSLFDAGAPLATDSAFRYVVDRDKAVKLPFRYFASYYINAPSSAEGAVERLKELNRNFKSKHFSVKTLKIVTDGVVENRKAALFEPYKDVPGRGSLNFDPKTLNQLAVDAAREGFDLYMHAIGDRAVNAGLNAAQAIREAGFKDTHITLSHVQLVRESDRPRFKQYHVMINSTGAWMRPYKDEEKVLGDRVNSEYPYRSMIDQGVLFVSGSDFPADPRIDPFLHLEISVTRQAPESPKSAKIKGPKNRLSIKEAIEAYTINGAKMLRVENQIGTLEKGKLADLIILDQNIVEGNPKDIHKTKVLMTMMGGKVWHDLLFGWGDSHDAPDPEIDFHWDGHSHEAPH